MSPVRPEDRPTWTFTLINALVMMTGSAIAAFALYPVYESVRYLSAMAVAVLGGAAAAVLAERLGRGPLVVSVLVLIVYVTGGLTLVVPGALVSADAAADALVELAVGPVTGWKDIVTLPLPLGSFSGTLVPIYALFLVGTAMTTWAAVHARRAWPLAAPGVALLVLTAVLLGPATRAAAPAWAPAGTFMSRELAVGLATFVLTLGWFVWRAAHTRRAARLRARSTEQPRLARRQSLQIVGGTVAVAAMLLLGVGTAALIAGPIAAETSREVARTVVDPRLTLASAVSPLATLRTYYSDDAYDAVLFRVNVTEGSPERVRIAALPYFDGESFTASAGPDQPTVRFERVPAVIDAAEGAQMVQATIMIGVGGGIWVPLVGELGSVDFEGVRRAQLVDGFYYLPETATGIESAGGGVVSGDQYTVRGYVRDAGTGLAALGSSPAAPTIDASLIPPALSEWVARQEVTRDGRGLDELLTRLRERGYLSHALDAAPDGGRYAWEEDLDGYVFASSAAGHSYDRIERLFLELLEREDIAEGTGEPSLVSGVGDEEQFAAAAALVAAELGFPSRVALGARLTTADSELSSTTPCTDGECQGRNITAWVEVQGADGRWIAADVTPQHEAPLAPDTTSETDPEHATDIDPERAEAIVPPSSQRGSSDDDPGFEEAFDDLSLWLLPSVRIGAAAALIALALLGPFLLILLWKSGRRRRRRRGNPEAAVHGGWDEYLDNALDAGHEAPPVATRAEAAAAFGTDNGARIAELTDRATFAGAATDPGEAEEFWRLVDADRAAWLGAAGWWGRLRMRVSLRSAWRGLASPRRTDGTERQRPGSWSPEHDTAGRHREAGRRSRGAHRKEGQR
ncbi:transglutaminase domain-containing protein [uncultured Demequina sp.]|uniref:transglutaminase domain-containing protein n=1 Tax=uncultured Demequina sp. TaxID=693499 RepID=UPI0025ED2CF7|nr:transglutaminase domain-containing protein [uncultured Demequina sp.]